MEGIFFVFGQLYKGSLGKLQSAFYMKSMVEVRLTLLYPGFLPLGHNSRLA